MKKNEIGSGILLNYLHIALFTISSLIITPALTGGLGDSIYGVYVTVFSVITFFNAADFGIAMPVIRNIVEYKASEDKKQLETYLFRTLLIYLLFSVVVFLLCMGIYFLSPYIFKAKFTLIEIDMFKKMFLIMATNSIFLFFVNYFFAIITAYDKFSFTRISNIIKVILRTVFLVLLVSKSLPPYVVFFVDLISSILLCVVYAAFSFKIGVRIKNHNNVSVKIKNTVSGMLLSYWMAMSENAFSTLCPTIIAACLGTIDAGRFFVAITFITIYIQLSATLSHLRIPKISKLWFSKDDDNAFWTYTMASGRIQSVVLGAILIGFIILGRIFLRLWVGSEFDDSYFVALIVMIPMFLSLSQSMLEVALYAQNKYFVRSIVLFISSAVNILFVWIGSKMFGLMGAGYAILTTTLIFNFLGMNFYYQRIYKKMKDFNINIILKMFPPIIVSSAVGLLIVNIDLSSVILAILGAASGFLVYIVMVYLLHFRHIDLRKIMKRGKFI